MPVTDKLPPHSEEAEAGVLGCLLLAPTETCPAILAKVGHDNPFYLLSHQEIWLAALWLYEHGKDIDSITLAQRLKDEGKLEQIGGQTYLSTLPDKTPSAANLAHYLDIVWEKYILRRKLQDNAEQSGRLYEYEGSVESFIGAVDQDHQRWMKLLERGAVTPKNLCAPSDFIDAYYDTWFHRVEDTYGWELPFAFPMRIRPHEMTLFTGDNGSGKSSMLGLISICCAKQFKNDEKIVVASMEVPPEITLWIMARQLLGVGKLDKTPENEKRIKDALTWLNKRVLLYNFLGITDWRELLNTFRYARRHRQGAIFIVDSVMRIGIPDDDYAMQGVVAAQFADFCVKEGAHVFLVVHENKGEGRQKDKVRGSKQWTDNAHNVCAVKRNEAKAEKLEEWKAELKAGELDADEFRAKLEGVAKVWDTKFILNKQRWPGSQQNASRWLYFKHDSLQFHEQPHDANFNWLL